LALAWLLVARDVLLALVAFFLAHDPDAGAILVTMALVTLTFAYLGGNASQKKLADSLRELDQAR
jgi:hypothetical protein